MIRRPICLLCLIFMAGIWAADALEVPRGREPGENPVILRYLAENPEEVTIYGQIYRRTPDGTAVYLKNSYLNIHSKIISLENVKVYMQEERSQGKILPVGADVLMTGKLEPIPPASNPGQFDSVLYYKTQHIYFRMVKGRGVLKKLSGYSYRETLERLRGRLSLSIEQVAGEYAPVYQAMLLGDKSGLEDEVKDRYQMAGMLHMLAISGLHLSLLGMGCYKILMRLGASIPLAGSLSVFFLFSYGIFTGEGVATMRALAMFVVVMGARLLGRTYDLLSAMALSAVLLLLDTPYYLFYSGFLLSFGCICGIAIVLPRLLRILEWKKQNPKKRKFFLGLCNALAASISIQLATLPITLYFFYEYPMYGILLNLAAIPALSAVLVSGIAGGLLGFFGASLGRVAALPGNVLLWGYDLLGVVAQKLPMTTWVAGQPKPWQIVLYYVILALALRLARPGEREYGKKKPPREVGAAILAGVGIALGICTLGMRAEGDLSITCLDVGQGDCLAVATPGGHHYLIDGGSSNIQEVGRYRILPYLKSRGISRLDYVWISHTDADHISGILEMLKLQGEDRSSVRIANLLLPDWKEKPDTYLELEEAALRSGVAVHYLKEGDILADGEALWKVIAPGNIQSGDPNEDAQVVLLTYRSFEALFTGDIGEKTEEKLLGQFPDVEYLKAAHHGSRYSTGEAFLRRVRPRIAVLSASASNTYGHPSPHTLKRLHQVGARTFCTKDRGAIMTLVRDDQIRVRCYLEEKGVENSEK